jgi:hypothetical protein
MTITSVDVYRTERAVYTPEDFVLWLEKGVLVITPKFQRRPVWRTPARSYFIDTLLRGMTVPPLYLRITQDLAKSKTIREVVDGQQRIRSVLDFVGEDGYRLAKNLKAPWAGKRFTDLSEEHQQQIMSYGFPTDMFKGISDQQIFEVFARLNMNGLQLNRQELRNGRFFGYFKQTCFSLGVKYLEFWRHNRIFSEQSIARMLEVELASELLISGNSGMQDKKKSIDDFYDKWDTSYPDQSKDEKRFEDTMGTISDTFGNGDLSTSAFRRPPLFYTLYCVVFHHMFGMEGIARVSPKRHLSADQKNSLRAAVVELSEVLISAKDPDEDIPKKHVAFVAACQRQTDNITPRKTRFNSLYEEAF